MYLQSLETAVKLASVAGARKGNGVEIGHARDAMRGGGEAGRGFGERKLALSLAPPNFPASFPFLAPATQATVKLSFSQMLFQSKNVFCRRKINLAMFQ